MLTSLENKDDISKKVEALLQNLKNEIDHTRQLHAVGINNSISSSLESFYINPLTAILDMHSTSRLSLKKMVSQLTIGFLHSQNKLITKAYQVEQDNKLIYHIVLKNDNSKTRDVFFNFLSLYDEIGISANLSVIIRFLPERVMEKANLKDELILN